MKCPVNDTEKGVSLSIMAQTSFDPLPSVLSLPIASIRDEDGRRRRDVRTRRQEPVPSNSGERSDNRTHGKCFIQPETESGNVEKSESRDVPPPSSANPLMGKTEL